MKRMVCLFFVLFLIVFTFPMTGNAVDHEDVIEFDDGSYAVVTISESVSRATMTKNGTKTYTYYSSTGTAKWKMVLSGSFAYNGFTSTCGTSSCDVFIFDSDWYVVSKNAGKIGNSANGQVTMGYKAYGITADTYSVSLALSCDINGNLS